MSTKQNDKCYFTKNSLERKNFIHANVQAVLKSCYCKNSLLQSLNLVVWLNNIGPSLLLRLWLRHRVFLGEKIESTAGVILRWSSGTTSTRKRCHAVLKLWGTTWRKSCKTSSLKIRIQEFHGLVHLTLLLEAINRNQWCSLVWDCLLDCVLNCWCLFSCTVLIGNVVGNVFIWHFFKSVDYVRQLFTLILGAAGQTFSIWTPTFFSCCGRSVFCSSLDRRPWILWCCWWYFRPF